MRTARLIVVGGGIACGGRGGIDFPHELAPLEPENLAPEAGYRDGASPAERVALVSGKRSEGFWAHGRGYVRADAAAVWAAAQVPEVSVDRREVDEWSVTHDTVPRFDQSYTIHNDVRDVLRVQFDITWVFEQQAGDDAVVERAVAQWDKTDGTQFIDRLRGSLVVIELEPGLTEVQLITHLKAALRDEETLETYLEDWYADLLATVRGEPLPRL